MSQIITTKKDFAVIIKVVNANPNGDPTNGNLPRTNSEGLGEITDVCLKRKIRNRLMDLGHSVSIQSSNKRVDSFSSIRNRIEGAVGKVNKSTDMDKFKSDVCKAFTDVRLFGQLLAWSEDSVSVPVTGPVSISFAKSIEPIITSEHKITKSCNSEGDGSKKTSDTMGNKYLVESAVYVMYGSINTQLAEKVGLTDDDVDVFIKCLQSLFQNDESSARPSGSMEILKVIVWHHNCKNGQYSSATVHKALKVMPTGSHTIESLEGLSVVELDESVF